MNSLEAALASNTERRKFRRIKNAIQLIMERAILKILSVKYLQKAISHDQEIGTILRNLTTFHVRKIYNMFVYRLVSSETIKMY